jgi:hypothetical protein
MATAVIWRRASADSGCCGIAAGAAVGRPSCEPRGATNVHETVQMLSTTRMIFLGGALAAALAGLGAGAAARPAASHAGQTLGPRLDFDLAAHTLPPTVGPPPTRLAAATSTPRAG